VFSLLFDFLDCDPSPRLRLADQGDLRDYEKNHRARQEETAFFFVAFKIEGRRGEMLLILTIAATN